MALLNATAAKKPSPARRRLETTALKQVLLPLTKAITAMPSERLQEIVASPAVEGAARVVEAAGLAEATRDPLAPARARAAARRTQLLETAGGTLEREEVMARTRVSHQTVSNWRRAGTILALPRGMRDFVYPACQFTETGLLPGLADVLRASSLKDPWSRLGMLLTPSDRLGGRSPLDALRQGQIEDAVVAANTAGTVGDEGAAKIRRRRIVAAR
jgi:hypothetical protein